MGARGSLFSFTTICSEVVERPFDRLTILSPIEGHHNFAYYETAPRNHITTATGVLCACPPSVVRFGGGYRLGRLLGVKMKRDPLAPFENARRAHYNKNFLTFGRFPAACCRDLQSAEGTPLFELLLGQDTRPMGNRL
jgi:hypothetical protein